MSSVEVQTVCVALFVWMLYKGIIYLAYMSDKGWRMNMNWTNWFVKTPAQEKPVEEDYKYPKSHKVEVIAVNRYSVWFSLDGGKAIDVTFRSGVKPEDAITEYINKLDEEEKERLAELKRVREEIAKRF